MLKRRVTEKTTFYDDLAIVEFSHNAPKYSHAEVRLYQSLYVAYQKLFNVRRPSKKTGAHH